MPADARLRITEVFFSLQGESSSVGCPTVFVRLTGCPLRCQYCDTAYAFQGGQWLTQTEILDQVAAYAPQYVCVTGGEPLSQKNCLPLLGALCDAGYKVSLETSGALDVSSVDPRVSRVLDMKTPGSKELERNLYSNLALLESKDQVKFVICDRNDYEWSVKTVADYTLVGRCEVLFSPSYGQIDAGELANWIIADRLRVRYQVQLHKILWGDARGR